MTAPEPKLRVAHSFDFVLLSEEELELLLYGRIGNSLFEEGVTAKMVGDTLSKAPKAKKLKVKLSSPGGNVSDGMAIRSMLSAHPAHVTMDIEGMAASAGSVIAMSGDTIRMHDGASMMLHEGRGFAEGNVQALQRTIAALETINDGAATVYAARTGKSKEEIRQLMAAETWFTPEQALAQKFVDEIVPAKKAPAATMYFDLGAYHYQNVPPEVAVRHQLGALQQLPLSYPPKHKTEEIMTYARIAISLGLPEGADENTILQKLDGFKTESARARGALAELCELTGKPTALESLGVVRAYQQDHQKVKELEKELQARDQKLEQQERDAILAADAADPKGHKLTPAMAKFWKDQPIAMLKAFMESASYVVTNVTRQAPPANPAPTDGTPTTTPAAVGGGGTQEPVKTTRYAQMSYMERHQLKRSDPEQHRQLRAEAAQAGEL